MDPLSQQATEETRESFEEELAATERKVAEKYGIKGRSLRLEIVRRIKDGTIPESSLVVHWLALYGTLLSRLRGSPPLDTSEQLTQEAAAGGLFFCPQF